MDNLHRSQVNVDLKKYIEPDLLSGTQKLKGGQFLGKVISNMKNSIITKFHRLETLITKGEWINNKAVVSKIQKNVADITARIHKEPGSVVDSHQMFHINIGQMKALCKQLNELGVVANAEDVIHSLDELDQEIANTETAPQEKKAVSPEKGKIEKM